MGKTRKIGNKWYIDYYAESRRYRECIGRSKKLAEQVLHKREVEIAEGKFLDKKNKFKVKLEDFADEYIELYSRHNKKTWDKDAGRLIPLKRFFGGKYLFMITPHQVEEYKSKRIKGELRVFKGKIKPATVNRELALLKHMFTMAIRWGKAEVNPVKKVKLFRENNQRLRYLEKEEAERLVRNCKGYLKRVVIIALNTGMRRGEILGLKWTDIDFRRGFMYLRDTKNGECREVPINDLVKQALIKQPRRSDSPYVFYNREGKAFQDLKKSFLVALRKSAIINFRFHDMRHTFASQLVMSGVDLNTVRELLGHKSIRMTIRYSHLSPAHKQRAVDVLGQKWSLYGQKRLNEQTSSSSDPEKPLTIKSFS